MVSGKLEPAVKAPQDSESRHADKYVVRLPDGMRELIADAARISGRSMNSEIVERLSVSLKGGNDTVIADLARQAFELRRLVSLLHVHLAQVYAEDPNTPRRDRWEALKAQTRPIITGFLDDDAANDAPADAAPEPQRPPLELSGSDRAVDDPRQRSLMDYDVVAQSDTSAGKAPKRVKKAPQG